jgi:hypothetical protein
MDRRSTAGGLVFLFLVWHFTQPIDAFALTCSSAMPPVFFSDAHRDQQLSPPPYIYVGIEGGVDVKLALADKYRSC